MKQISIYDMSKQKGKEYYEVYCDGWGLSATIHSFDAFPDTGIITLLKNCLSYSEIRKAFTEWKG